MMAVRLSGKGVRKVSPGMVSPWVSCPPVPVGNRSARRAAKKAKGKTRKQSQ